MTANDGATGGPIQVLVDRALVIEALGRSAWGRHGDNVTVFERFADEQRKTAFVIDGTHLSSLHDAVAQLVSSTIKFDVLLGQKLGHGQSWINNALFQTIAANEHVRIEAENYRMLKRSSVGHSKEDIGYCLWLIGKSLDLSARILVHERRADLLSAVISALDHKLQDVTKSGGFHCADYGADTTRGIGALRLYWPSASVEKTGRIVSPAAIRDDGDVFISYSRPDWQVANGLVKYLAGLGYVTWWDNKLIGSDEFREVIQRRLDAAKAVIVIWSRQSVTSRFVREEAAEGLRLSKLIATRMRDLEIASIPLGFREQHVDVVTERVKIVAALAALGVQPRQSDLSSGAAVADPVASSQSMRVQETK